MTASTLRRVGRNIRWLAVSNIASRLIGFVYIAAVARLLGIEQFGLLTLGLAYTEMLNLLAGLSFSELLIRDAAPDRSRLVPELSAMVAIQIAGLLPIVGIGIALGLAYGGVLALVLPIGAVTGWVRALSRTFLAVSTSQEDLRPMSVYATLERLLNLAAIPVLLLAGETVIVLFLALLGGAVLNLVYAILSARPFGALRGWPANPFQEWRCLVRDGIAYSVLRWVGVVYKRLDAVILERLAGPEAVGLYGAAYRLFEVLGTIPIMAETTLQPLLSRCRNSISETRQVLLHSTKALATVSVPMTIGAWALAAPAVRLIYGNDFAVAANAWWILMVALVFASIDRPFMVLLRMEGRVAIATYLTTLAVVLNLALNLWLIPSWDGDIRAPALAKAIGEAVLCAGLWWACRHRAGSALARSLLRLLPAGGAMLAVLFLLRPWGPWIAGLGGGLVYVLVVYFVIGLDAPERRGLRQLLRP